MFKIGSNRIAQWRVLEFIFCNKYNEIKRFFHTVAPVLQQAQRNIVNLSHFQPNAGSPKNCKIIMFYDTFRFVEIAGIKNNRKRQQGFQTEALGNLRATSLHMLCAFTQSPQRHKDPSSQGKNRRGTRKKQI